MFSKCKVKSMALVGVSLLAGSISVSSFAGTSIGGGGDSCELRIDEIRSDILSWIQEGGAKGLVFPEAIDLSQYINGMTSVLAKTQEGQHVVLGCVSTQQENFEKEKQNPNLELIVSVDGQPKTCRGFVSQVDGKPHILCNIDRFSGKMISAEEQYQLIHHEYAGLAGLERNVRASSDYFISKQLVDFLAVRSVVRLAISRRSSSNGPYDYCTNIKDLPEIPTDKSPDMLANLKTCGNFTILLKALKETGLERWFSYWPTQIFAPTDQAFRKLPAQQLQELLSNREELTKVISYHLTQRVSDLGVFGDLTRKVETYAQVYDKRYTLRFERLENGDIYLNNEAKYVGFINGGSHIGGIAYVIDTVLIPRISKE